MNKIGLLLLFVLQTTNTIFAESCSTPNNETGEVKPLTLCSELLNLFTNTPRKSENYLNGFIVKDSLEPLVCCSSSVNIKASENKEKYGRVSLEEDDYILNSGIWFKIKNEIPWLVGIHNNNSKSNLRCSGTIINQRYVITAAECVAVDNSNIEVVVRDDEQGPIKNRTYHVEELIVHPFYNIIPGLNNIALLRLSESVFLRDLNARILFPDLWPQPGANSSLKNVDWRRRITHGPISYHKLLSNERCQELFKKANIMRLITEYDICTESLNPSKSTTPQNYEIGSPIMFHYDHYYLTGIISSSFENTTIPKLSPKFSQYRKWIENNMRPYTRSCKISDKVFHCVSAIVCPKKIHEIADDNRDALEEYISDRNECYDKRLSCCDTSIPQPEPPPRTPYKSRILVNYTDCGISNKTFRNMNDTRLHNHNFPWLADITVFNKKGIYNEETLCGGVFLNNRYVLTTAECLDRAHYDWQYTVVRYAKTNKKVDCGLSNCFNYIESDIYLWYPHKFFIETDNFNNIGLIRLAETIPLSDLTWPICLRPPEELSPKPGDTLYIYDLNNSTFRNPFVLESTMISNEECQKIYKEKNRTEIISSYHFCSNFKRYDSCDGFLGGVVMFEKDDRWFVAGVGARYCVLGLPAIHTNAQYYLKWIENNIKQDPCTTIDGKQGECVSLYECPQYVELMANPTNSTVKDLEKLMCSKQDLEVKVCCNKPGASLYFNKTQNATVASNQTNPEDKRIQKYCGYQHPDDYEGQLNEQTSIDEYPWLAVIYQKRKQDDEPKVVCGGSVIHPQYVLTAGQCIKLLPRYSKLTKVRLGEFNIKNTTDCIMHDKNIGEECTTYEEYDIAEIIPHPFFSSSDRGKLNDIGLLRLAKRIVWTEYIRPICLPDLTHQPKPGAVLYTTGFGKISAEKGTTTVELKKRVSTTFLAPNQCKQRLLEGHLNIRLTIHDLCTIDFINNTDFTCQGDGGGPLMYKRRNRWFLEGISSRGARCGEGDPELHTKVSSYLPWIKSNIWR